MDQKVPYWNWDQVKEDVWKIPSKHIYFYLHEWKMKGYKQILDLGCGIGRHSILFAQNGFHMTGCDSSETGINILNEYLKENPDLMIETHICDMNNLKFPDNSFDAVICYHTISHNDFDGIKQTLSEINRVLKQNGEIFVTLLSNAGLEEDDKNKKIIYMNEYGMDIQHYFCDYSDVLTLMKDFHLKSVDQISEYLVFLPRRYRKPGAINFYVNASKR